MSTKSPIAVDGPVITTTSARALISSKRHPHLNPLSAPPSRDPRGGGREASGEGAILLFFFHLHVSAVKEIRGGYAYKNPCEESGCARGKKQTETQRRSAPWRHAIWARN